MKLTITLSPSEETNMRAWAAYLAANPSYIGKPTGNWNHGQPDYQSKIILEDQTRVRYDEIAAQFGTADDSAPHVGPPWGQEPDDLVGRGRKVDLAPYPASQAIPFTVKPGQAGGENASIGMDQTHVRCWMTIRKTPTGPNIGGGGGAGAALAQIPSEPGDYLAVCGLQEDEPAAVGRARISLPI